MTLSVPGGRISIASFSYGWHSRSRHHKHGTLSLLTLDPALPYRHLNAISKPTFSLILNWRHKRLCIPRRTLWRYTNVVLLLLLLFQHLRSICRDLLRVISFTAMLESFVGSWIVTSQLDYRQCGALKDRRLGKKEILIGAAILKDLPPLMMLNDAPIDRVVT